MKATNLLLLSFLSVSIALAGCHDEATAPTPPTKTDLISAGVYKLQAIAVVNGADVTGNIGVVTVKYSADGTVLQTLKDGTTNAGTWKWLENETQIEVTTKLFGKSTWRVLDVTATVFNKVSSDFKSVVGGDLRYNQTRQ